MFYSAHRDQKKSKPLGPHDMAPDMFDAPPKVEHDDQAEFDRIGESLMQSFGGFGDG